MCIAELVANHPLSPLFLPVFFVQGVTVEAFSCFRMESNSNFIRHIYFLCDGTFLHFLFDIFSCVARPLIDGPEKCVEKYSERLDRLCGTRTTT